MRSTQQQHTSIREGLKMVQNMVLVSILKKRNLEFKEEELPFKDYKDSGKMTILLV